MNVFIISAHTLAIFILNINLKQVNGDYQTSQNLNISPVQYVSNSSLNSSIWENQLQEQNTLSNTSLLDVQNNNNTQQLQIRFRERKRQERLLLIQTLILQRLGITGRSANTTNVNTFSDQERDLLDRVVAGAPTPRTRTVTGVNEISSSEIFAERLQSFYPSCSVPNHTDHTLWNQNSNYEMRLFYDITFPRSSETGTQVSALSAKLRVYKFNDPPVEPTPLNSILSDENYRVVSQQGLSVSLYQYLRPLRHNRREKKRLIDSRTVSSGFRGFVEFNILNAINHWQNNPIRNFGLYIDIETPFGSRLDPSLYLSQMNCSVQDTPMPNLADIYPDMNNQTWIFDNESYPTLDLRTIEVSQEQQITSPAVNISANTSRRRRLAQRLSNKNKCKTEKTHISVKDLNLEDVVIYPTTLETVACSGPCKTYQKTSHDCQPSNYKDIEIVYLTDKGNPKIKKLDKFLPQSCHCVKTKQ